MTDDLIRPEVMFAIKLTLALAVVVLAWLMLRGVRSFWKE